MKLKTFYRGAQPGRLTSLLLVLLLLSAALHVSQHDLMEGSGGPLGHSDCQLSHVPVAQFCMPAAPMPLLALVFILAFAATPAFTTRVMRHQRIRAPPLAS